MLLISIAFWHLKLRVHRKVHLHLGAHDICDEDWTSSHLVRKEYMVFHPSYNPE